MAPFMFDTSMRLGWISFIIAAIFIFFSLGRRHCVLGSLEKLKLLLCRNTSSHFIEDNDDEFSCFESWYASRCNSSSCTQKSELDVYLEEPLAPRNKELNILRWWRFNPKFHILAKMARDLLAIPVSTIASEFAFSIGGRVLDQTRGCLAPEIVEALIYAQDWLETPKTK